MTASPASLQESQYSSSANSSLDLKNLEKKHSQEEVTPNYLKIFSRVKPFRIFQLIKNGCKWPIIYAKELNLSSDIVSKFFKANVFFKEAGRALIITKIPYTVDSLYQEYKNVDEKNSIRRRDKLAKKIVEIVADCSVFLQLGEIIGIYVLGSVISPAAAFTGSLFLLFQNMFSLKMEREDYIAHKILQNSEKENIKDSKRLTTLLPEIRNLDLLKIAKSIASIALGFFMVAELAFSISILSPAALLILSTASTVLAIWTHFYQESMTYPLKG